MAEVQVDFE